MIDHQLRKFVAIHEHDLVGNAFHELARVVSETGGCDEDAFPSALALQRSGKLLHMRTSDGVCVPAFGLDVDQIKTELVFLPEFAWLPRGGRTLYINLPDGEGERVRMVDTALIERLEPHD